MIDLALQFIISQAYLRINYDICHTEIFSFARSNYNAEPEKPGLIIDSLDLLKKYRTARECSELCLVPVAAAFPSSGFQQIIEALRVSDSQIAHVV